MRGKLFGLTLIVTCFAVACASETGQRGDVATLTDGGPRDSRDGATDATDTRDAGNDADGGPQAKVAIQLTVADTVPSVLGSEYWNLLYVPKQRARKRELVSVGVPIADESQVRDASEFGLEGA
ncbi:MAG: hypothetical protein JRH20_25340, partial [Deltaproteobacteria bacterium]|nr:hypothetical protein [Deltaproteobacteria bacterium]